MENSIVKDFQNLKVLTAFDSQKMDLLVQDLTNALEETSKSQKSNGGASNSGKKSNKKRRCKKRKPNSNINMSEASGSSIDEALKDYMEALTQPSDSDDVTQIFPPMTMVNLTHAISLPESDSVTENFSPMRPHRRRRKFKRMAVDMPPDPPKMGLPDFQTSVQKPIKPKVRTLDSKDENVMDVENRELSHSPMTYASDTAPGKRKRGMKDKGSNSFDIDQITGIKNAAFSSEMDPSGMECNHFAHESSSSISSGESDIGIFTNDEGRDGDDEQSDFFHEPGPACGIPGIISWWENDPLGAGDMTQTKDPNFEQILTGSFELLSPAAKRSFKCRLKNMGKPGREMRSGRRRLDDRDPEYSVSSFLQDRQQWSDNVKNCRHGNGASNSGDSKRRRKTPPPCPAAMEGHVGENAAPIPDTNIGNQMLQNMGWNPGDGLGADGAGIVTPVTAYRRPRRAGLGSSKQS